MASIQQIKKSGRWHCQFYYEGEHYTVSFGLVSETEARGRKAAIELRIARLEQGLLTIPDGCSVSKYFKHDGNPPQTKAAKPAVSTFAQLRDEYLASLSGGTVEANTAYTAKIHLKHLEKTLKPNFAIAGLQHSHLQSHIEKRKSKVAPTTIRKELDTLRQAWHYAVRMGYAKGDFPSAGLMFPKDAEKEPFRTREEIERRIEAGGDPETIWECLYLTESELTEFLDFAERKAPQYLYAMCVMAAHAGARRSEMFRAQRQDVDFEGGFITIREKKKQRGRTTTRRVPLSDRLRAVLQSLPKSGSKLFKSPTIVGVQKAFTRLVGKHPSAAKSKKLKAAREAARRSKWAVLNGFHTLRHCFISCLASKGVDQRLVESWAGHMTKQMSARYMHLYPNVQKETLTRVFG